MIGDRISDSDRCRRYSWYFDSHDSVSDRHSLLAIVTIFLVGYSLGKIMIYLIFVIFLVGYTLGKSFFMDDGISDSDIRRWYSDIFDSVSDNLYLRDRGKGDIFQNAHDINDIMW